MIYGQNVECVCRAKIPVDNENIGEIVNIQALFKEEFSIHWYHRSAVDCPYGRGNAIIDIELKNGSIFCIKLPLETTKEQILNFIKPISEKLNNKTNRILLSVGINEEDALKRL